MVTGRIVLNEEITGIVEDAKLILGIKMQSMAESVKRICEIAVEQRNDLHAFLVKSKDLGEYSLRIDEKYFKLAKK